MDSDFGLFNKFMGFLRNEQLIFGVNFLSYVASAGIFIEEWVCGLVCGVLCGSQNKQKIGFLALGIVYLIIFILIF